MQQARHQRPGPVWIPTLSVAILALSGCTLVGDRLTGVSLTRNGQTGCIQECNARFKDEFESEQKRHLEEVERCQELSQPDKEACLEAEGARHTAAMDSLGEAKTECQNECHRQGQVSAG